MNPSRKPTALFNLLGCLITLLFSLTATTAWADELDKDENFTVTQYKDHLHFKIMIMDGKGKDTWCRVGSIHAYSGPFKTGTHIQLMDVECDQGEDDSTDKEIFSRNVHEGTRAFLTNPASGVETLIDFADWANWGDGNNDDVRKNRPSSVRYTIKKSSSELRPYVEIDYYWSADMADKIWYFTYEFIHNGGSFKSRNMGLAACSKDLGFGSMDKNDYSFRRDGGNHIVFSLPALPNDIPDKLKTYISHYGEYQLKFTYTKQDGSVVTQEEYLSCANNKKEAILTIPSEAGNFKQADLEMSIHWGLKWYNGPVKGYVTQGAKKKNIFTSVPVPFGLAAEYNQYDNRASLSWNAFPTGDNNYIKESVPYIYRIETDKNGKPVSGAKWMNRGKNPLVGEEQAEGYTDNMLADNTYYQYMVVNVPKAWVDNGQISSESLNSPDDELLNQLGYCQSSVMATTPVMSIFNLKQDTAIVDKVRLTWEYSRVPIKSNNVRFEVWKRQKGATEWNNYGNVTAPANPSAGYVASFTDSQLPSNRETFEYKVILSINSEKNTFESDVITAGLLTGSAVLNVDATKGTHDKVVRVSWKVRQVGTANSNFEVYRRYAGTTDEFLKVHSVSGTSDSYTYEDNTVQPGYYYEYRVDVYSGDKESYTDNNFQNFLSDVGFCEARGVINGRVTFGTGSAVEDVRLSLRSSADSDGNVVRGFSQRFDGTSTGIKWDADSAEIVQLFDSKQDFTVQLFLRPDDNLTEGAVIGEIPSVGRLRLGSKEGEDYKLLLEKYSEKTIEKGLFSNVLHVRTILYSDKTDKFTEKTNYSGFGDIYTFGEAAGIRAAWRDEGEGHLSSNGVIIPAYASPTGSALYLGVDYWYETANVNLSLEKETWQGTWYDTGLTLPAYTFSLVSLLRSGGELSAIVDEQASTTFTQVSTKDYSIGNSIIPSDVKIYNGKLLYSDEGNLSEFGLNQILQRNEFGPNGYFTTLIRPVMNPFSVGGSAGIDESEAFMGNITEVRVWNHVLSEKEQKSTFDRVLTGSEKGLGLYWPMDEGVSHFVFDASYANDRPNSRHATVGNNISTSNIIPTDAQLSRYGLTNENGEYTVRGLPFVGSGTTYTVTPSKGIHVFSPVSRNGFIGSGSLALNGYDFTDTSSFPVRGRITYLDTNIPADSIQFKIDGQLVQGASNKMVMTDGNGDYEISVPIGKHLIECFREGHHLTSFPLDGTTYDFKQEMTVNFVDSTLVNVTGRINGGFSDQDEPVGFARSTNRLGKATIKLSLGQESNCSFNYVLDDHGSGEFGKTPIPVMSATEKIKSTSYRAAATESDSDTRYIYITTDPNTGEYSALLPPLNYKVESITFDGGKDYDDKDVFAQNLPFINATNTIERTWRSDSMTVDGINTKYTYAAKMNRQYRAAPSITFEQVGMKNGAFGEEKVPVVSFTESVDSVTVLTYSGDSFKYEYDYPIFMQEHPYEYDIAVAESYKNLDTGETFDEVPSDAVIAIENDACASVSFFCEEGFIDGEKVTPGMTYDVPNIRLKPNKDGHATYQFMGGIPNLATSHLRSINVSVIVDNRTTMWNNPKTSKPELDLILLGSLSSGNQNFVTSGPAQPDMILRRPPGSTSEAVLITDTLTSDMKLEAHVRDGGSTGGGFYVSAVPEITKNIDVALGRVYVEAKFQPQLNTQEVWDNVSSTIDETDTGSKYTVSTEIHGTTDGIQYHGDTYIGRATNMLFGKGSTLGFFKQDDGTYKIDVHESIVVSERFGTYFAFPQEYIEETLIPNWRAIIKARLTEGHITKEHWVDGNCPVVPGKVMYYTMYQEGDPEFGRSNGDSRWGNLIAARGGHPSYRMRVEEGTTVDDEVDNAIRQIKAWEQIIAMNEEDKLKAINGSGYFMQNYSIAGGTSIKQTTTTEAVYVKRDGTEHEYNFDSESHAGFMYSGAGGYAILHVTKKRSDRDVKEKEKTISTSVEWTMSDGDPRTALSVDVYKSPMGFGPIFRTRGGQSVNPWEDATYTQYYSKGTKLDEATMRVEWPQLRVDGSTTLSNVPTGGQGAFKLEMTNLSQTNSDCTYILEAIESSNAQGAILMIDGMPLSLGKSGRAISLKGDKVPVYKMLYVSQSDRSVTKFEDLQLVLRSEKDDNMTSDTLHLKVEFVPASAIVDMSVAHTVLNLKDKKLYGGFQVSFTNLDRQDQGLKGVRVQYRRKGTDSWSQAHRWVVNEADLEQGDELLPPTDNTFGCAVSFPTDGIYELRGQTYGKYGNDDVTYETAIIEVTQDTRGPKVLGMPSHDNGTLLYTDRNDMHVRFNEPINDNSMSESYNFRIDGDLNNVAVKSQYADVALQLNGEEMSTEASYIFNDDNLAFGLWFYRQGDGQIVSLGSASNKLVLYTQDGGKLSVRTGEDDNVVETNTVLPADQWNYLALAYKAKDDSDPNNRLTLLYVNSDTNSGPVYAVDNGEAGDLDGEGKLSVGGDGMMGMMYDLTLWNSDMSATELYETREEQKANYTPGLIGYWKMDEGHGTLVSDDVRSRHIILSSESWYVNNRNRAAYLDGTEPLMVDISTANSQQTDNFAVEMWFRGDNTAANGHAQLLSVRNAMSIGFNQGKLVLEKSKTTILNDNTEDKTVLETILLSDVNYLDNNWHHIALNVRRGTSAVFYIDGQAAKTIPEASIPAITGHYIFVGGEETMVAPDGSNVGGFINQFIGDVDEVRLWNAAIGSDILADRRYERLDNTYAGLIGYFPMEEINRDKTGDIESALSSKNFGVSDSQVSLEGTLIQSANAPALLPGSSRIRLDDKDFDFTVSNDEIYFSFPETMYPLMDGNEFDLTVKNIADEHGNDSEPVMWRFSCDFAAVGWLENEVSVEKQWDESKTFSVTILNKVGSKQSFEISGLPSWMTVDKSIGILDNSYESRIFTILPSAPIGRYTEHIVLTDKQGIKRMLDVVVTITGDEPEWAVKENLYESNMLLTGQIYIGDKISEYTNSKIAAFDPEGNCRGVGSPRYVDTRDAYYVDMVIYGGSETGLSSAQRKLTFKYYDASTGRTYPLVVMQLASEKELQIELIYAPDATYGSYDEPVKFIAEDIIEQNLELQKGWSWKSVYVDPVFPTLDLCLPNNTSDRSKLMNVKGHKEFATYDKKTDSMTGELYKIVPGKMYKIQTSANLEWPFFGKPIDVTTTAQTIYPGFNWIGTLASKVMSPADAFADLNPQKGDMVKNRTTSATYNGQGKWEGTLKSIVPGEGYIYLSKATEEKNFHYPQLSADNVAQAPPSVMDVDSEPTLLSSYFTPVDEHLFPDNMNMIAVVQKNGMLIENAEVGAFVDGECRGAVTCIDGYYFLSILGSSLDDINSTVEIRVYAYGDEYTEVSTQQFISDAMIGTLDEPFVLDLDASGIRTIYADEAEDDYEWYTLQGVKIGSKPTQQGVYIHKGKKVVIKRNKR